MIIPLHTTGWFTDSQKFSKVALDLNQVLFTKDAKGEFQKVTSMEGIQQDTPLFIELDMFLDLYVLAEHFDIMIRSTQDGVVLFLDSKGGRFRQR